MVVPVMHKKLFVGALVIPARVWLRSGAPTVPAVVAFVDLIGVYLIAHVRPGVASDRGERTPVPSMRRWGTIPSPPVTGVRRWRWRWRLPRVWHGR